MTCKRCAISLGKSVSMWRRTRIFFLHNQYIFARREIRLPPQPKSEYIQTTFTSQIEGNSVSELQSRARMQFLRGRQIDFEMPLAATLAEGNRCDRYVSYICRLFKLYVRIHRSGLKLQLHRKKSQLQWNYIL